MVSSSLWRARAALASTACSSKHGIFSLCESAWRFENYSGGQHVPFHSDGSSCRGAHCSENTPGPGVVHLGAERGAVSVQGESTLGFLQNLVTQDTSLLSESNPNVYCHMLNSKGRFLYDVFLHRMAHDHVVVDVAQQRKDSLVKMLKMYSLRSGVRIQDDSDTFYVMTRFGGSGDGFGEDARLGSVLGYRGVSVDTVPELPKDARVIPVSEYTKLRLSLGVAEGPDEIPEGSVPLEYNLDGLNGISFSKGCYIGQELMARTHYQGQIRKRIMPFRMNIGECVSPGDDIIDAETKKKVGTVRSMCVDGFGLALMRTASVLRDDGDLVESLQVQSSGASIHPFIPSWWPASYLS